MFEKEGFSSWFKENTPEKGLSENTTFTRQFLIDAWNDGYIKANKETNENLQKEIDELKRLLKKYYENLLLSYGI